MTCSLTCRSSSRSAVAGATVVVGFLLAFGAAWVLVATGIHAMIAAVPWATLVVGGVV